MVTDDAKKQINDLLQEVENEINGTSLTKEEKAEEIITTAKVYMDAMTEINNNYNEALKDLLGELKELQTKSDEIKEANKLTKVRISLYK
jgi:CHASE3 domain sensor protein